MSIQNGDGIANEYRVLTNKLDEVNDSLSKIQISGLKQRLEEAWEIVLLNKPLIIERRRSDRRSR